MTNCDLSAARRERELAEATDGRVVDLLVVGLGVTGAGVALDAVTRGLTVVAIDAHDLAFGTSRWSSKLVHGGLRYLANGQLRVARECAVERGILLTRTAPHLVHPLPMVLPLGPMVAPEQGAIAAAGLRLGDALRVGAHTPRSALPAPRRLSPAEALELAPGLRRQGLRGALLSWEGQLEDDARLVVALARTAAGHGARILTRCRAVELAADGAVLRDELTGESHSIRARAVICATGVWSSLLTPTVAVRPSRGTHLVVRSATLGFPTAALTVPVPGANNRYVFALPQPDGLSYIGLTDEPAPGEPVDVPQPTPTEIGFLLDVINTALERAITLNDVVGAFAGLRPLLDAAGASADLSRRHSVVVSSAGLVTVLGGKLTTYRRMAEDAVDVAVRARKLAAGACRTRSLALVGAGDFATFAAALPAVHPRLVRRFGIEAHRFTRDPALLAPISPTIPTSLAELIWGIECEGALDIDDLLDRRTRIGLVPADRLVAEPIAVEAFALATS